MPLLRKRFAVLSCLLKIDIKGIPGFSNQNDHAFRGQNRCAVFTDRGEINALAIVIRNKFQRDW